jgi:N-acetylglucosaminyldiphosphoundecaprenol N-acetyl-beta-D-mannosaminyltransferase
MTRVWLLGYPVDCVTPEQGLAHVNAAWQQGQRLVGVTLNPEMMMAGEQTPEFGQLLKKADLVLPDGAGLVWALRRAGHTVNRLPGIEFAERLLAEAGRQQLPVALIGARPEVLAEAQKNLEARYGIHVVYAHHGFFDNAEAVARACAETRPQLVLVALGVPRQENWIDRYSTFFESGVFLGVGGSMDVWSGQTRRAPAWMRRLNLEWLYRITSEPWRIRRVYKTLPLFVVKVLLSRR